MSIYTPTAVRMTPFDTPDDGDDVSAASVGIGLEALADGVEWLNDRVGPSTLIVPIVGQPLYVTATGGAASALDMTVYAPTASQEYAPITAANTGIKQSQKLRAEVVSTGSTNWGWLVPLDRLPAGATLTAARLRLVIKGAHAALPTRQPYFGIFRCGDPTGLSALPTALLSTGNGLAQLAIGAVGLYDGDQTLAFAADQNNTIDATKRYVAHIWDEGGTNAVAFNEYGQIEIDFTY
jgi:hypothetical protein